MKEQPPRLGEEEKARILALSRDIPALWNASETTAADRKEVVRLLVERVVVHVRPDSERAEAVITWRGGVTTRHELVRSVAKYDYLSDYDQLVARVVQLRHEGLTMAQIAGQINSEGYHTPISRKGYTTTSVRKLLSRRGLTKEKIGAGRLETNETWLPDLARELRMPADKFREWALRGWVRSRQVLSQGLWIVWADGRERRRLQRLVAEWERGKEQKNVIQK